MLYRFHRGVNNGKNEQSLAHILHRYEIHIFLTKPIIRKKKTASNANKNAFDTALKCLRMLHPFWNIMTLFVMLTKCRCNLPSKFRFQYNSSTIKMDFC